MRIKCPNCGAQYEVDDALIPDAGRDVQCSNCGKGWFQKKFEDAAEAAGKDTAADEKPAHDEARDARQHAEAEELEDEDGDAPEADEPSEEPEAPAGEDRESAARPEDDHEEEDEADEDETPPPQPASAPRRPDEDALEILREEAERELRARRREAATIETQTEFGLEEGTRPASGEEGVKDRLAKLRGTDAAGAAAAVSSSARRDLLPDIEVINSTLRSDAERAGDAESDADYRDEAATGRRGFRLGFALMVLLAAVLLFLYIWAPTLARQFPGMESFLIVYVEAANTFRGWLESLLSRAIDAMTG